MTAQPVYEQYPDFWYLAKLGQVFSAATAATGVAPGTSIGTTAAFALYNPAGSGVNLVVIESAMGYVSGTLGAGVVHYVVNSNPAAAAVSGTAIVPVNHYLGGATAQAAPKTTATLPASPTLLRPVWNLGASLATTAVQPWQVKDAVNGQIVVPPGCCLSLEASAAAGTSPLVMFSMTWAEVATSA